MPEAFDQALPILTLTLEVSGIAVLVSSLLGIPLGLALGLSREHLRRPLLGLVQTSMAMPPVVVGLALYLLLSRSGPLSHLGWLFTPWAMILAQVILSLPFVVGITATSVAAVPSELPEQLRALGAGRRQAFLAVLREARAGVVLSVAAAMGRSLSEVGAVLMVGGNIRDHTRVLTTAILLETGKGRFELALVLGGVLLALAMTINLLVLRTHGRRPIPTTL